MALITMAFVRVLNILLRDKNLKNRIVPIVPDESRTFGMEGMFRQLGIWSSVGQLYTPEDADQLMFYKEDKNGQILQEVLMKLVLCLLGLPQLLPIQIMEFQ